MLGNFAKKKSIIDVRHSPTNTSRLQLTNKKVLAQNNIKD